MPPPGLYIRGGLTSPFPASATLSGQATRQIRYTVLSQSVNGVQGVLRGVRTGSHWCAGRIARGSNGLDARGRSHYIVSLTQYCLLCSQGTWSRATGHTDIEAVAKLEPAGCVQGAEAAGTSHPRAGPEGADPLHRMRGAALLSLSVPQPSTGRMALFARGPPEGGVTGCCLLAATIFRMYASMSAWDASFACTCTVPSL